jgi:hypothetical protein
MLYLLNLWEKNAVLLTISNFMLFISFSPLINRFQPPALLFLATSNPESLFLLAQIDKSLPWLRIASLLNMDVDTDIGSIIGASTKFRTSDAVIWREVVQKLMDISEIIVLDARHVSSPILEEARWVLERMSLKQCYFVIGVQKEKPVLDYFGNKSKLVSDDYLFTQEELLLFIQNIK